MTATDDSPMGPVIRSKREPEDSMARQRRPGYDESPGARCRCAAPLGVSLTAPDCPMHGERCSICAGVGGHTDNCPRAEREYAPGGLITDGPAYQITGPARVERERDRLLREAGNLISGDREDVYGSAIADFTRTGKLWAAVLGLDEVSAEQVALCMALVKVGRLCQTPNHRDSWIDILGYAALGGDIAATPGRYL